MRFDYDESADALYIAVSDDESHVARTVQIDTGTLVDVDEKGSVVGIEVLRPARDWPMQEIIDTYTLPLDVVKRLRFFFGPDAPYKTFPFVRSSAGVLASA